MARAQQSRGEKCGLEPIQGGVAGAPHGGNRHTPRPGGRAGSPCDLVVVEHPRKRRCMGPRRPHLQRRPQTRLEYRRRPRLPRRERLSVTPGRRRMLARRVRGTSRVQEGRPVRGAATHCLRADSALRFHGHVARGLSLRMDHATPSLADDFRHPLRPWAITPSFASLAEARQPHTLRETQTKAT